MVHSGMRGRDNRPARGIALALAGVLMIALIPATASGQANGYDPPRTPTESIDKVNALLGYVDEDERAETVLFPALIGMDVAPGVLMDPRQAALITPDHPSWDVVRQWAEGEAQVKAIEALQEITEYQSPFLIALPYGDSAPAEFIEAGIAVDLGEANLLALAHFDYLDAFQSLSMLVQVKATMLADGGDVGASLELLIRLARLGRMTLSRVFAEEHYWGYATVRLALERMRDIAYVYDGNAIEADYLNAVEELDPRDVAFGRVQVPLGDKHAALQMIVATIEFRGEPHPDQFAPTLARTSAADRELRLFSQAARWDAIADNHKGWYDTIDKLKGLYDDWILRWKLSPHDSISSMTEYERMDKAHFAILDEVIGNLEPLFDERLNMRLEMAGTRTALAVMAYHKRFNAWPSPLAAIRPHFIAEIDLDPFDPSEEIKVDYLQYFVPIRDFRKNERVDPDPYVIDVSVGGEGAPSLSQFSASVDELVENLSNAATEEQLQRMPMEEILRPFVGLENDEATIRANLESIREAVDELAVPGQDRAASQEELERLGFTQEDRDEFEVKGIMKMLSDEQFVNLVAKVGAGQPLSGDEKLAVLSISLKTTASVMLESQKLMGDDAVASFQVVLDDSTFVLYSVGYNGERDWAKSVGQGASDILMWPPMLSLVRDN